MAPDQGAAVQLIFGTLDGAEDALLESGGRAGEVLAEVFPIPALWVRCELPLAAVPAPLQIANVRKPRFESNRGFRVGSMRICTYVDPPTGAGRRGMTTFSRRTRSAGPGGTAGSSNGALPGRELVPALHPRPPARRRLHRSAGPASICRGWNAAGGRPSTASFRVSGLRVKITAEPAFASTCRTTPMSLSSRATPRGVG